MTALNVANRTLAIMDNLPFLRALNNECVDLIAIDPPFAANETFLRTPKPPISDRELAEEVALAAAHGVPHNEGRGETRVLDIWNWDEDIHPAWKMQIEDDYPAIHAVIQAVETCATENEAAYIAYMAVRLIECRRALKPTGSIYLHCDDHANGYLRMLMDAVFGPDSFRNEVVWRRYGSHNDAGVRFGRIHDTLFFYSKGAAYTWTDEAREPYDDEYIARAYRNSDAVGRYATVPLHARGLSGGGYELEWRGIQDRWRFSRERLDEMDAAGLIHWPVRGRIPRRKVYLDPDKGIPARDIILDVKPLSRTENTGYATQKPLALYERIIAASSNPGDVVLDVFAGCATTAIAAERLGRQWVACDMAYRAWTMLKRRFYLNGIMLEGMTDSTRDALASVAKGRGFQEPQQWTTSRVIGPRELPARDDVDPAPHHRLSPARRSAQSASWSGRIPKDAAKRLLIERFGPVCWGCGYEPRRPNGSLDDTLLEVDHIRARRAAEGTPGNDELYNLALLHRTCNGIKRNRLTLEELRAYNADHGLLYVNTVRDLVDLYEATQFAAEQIAVHTAEHGLPAG